ncbi:hypothetical protein BH23BAC3_BH23BAC3_18870 [soil metagenome]
MKTSKSFHVENGLLWGVAIITSALLGAPIFLTLIILPVLGFISVVNHQASCKIR